MIVYVGICCQADLLDLKKMLFALQQVFMIKPIENSPQCMTWVPYTKSVHEDAVLFGDDQGGITIIRFFKDIHLTAIDPNRQDKGDVDAPSCTECHLLQQ